MSMKNLIILAAGDESLHAHWLYPNRDFDLYIIYYGKTKDKFLNDSTYYKKDTGNKFHLVARILEDKVLDEYDAIFIPDDDLYLSQWDINKFFRLFHKHNLALAQPAIMGWLSHPRTAPILTNELRFTNWVEIMCPCFSREAFKLCSTVFLENSTSWGIEWLWSKLLGYPKDKISIVDNVVAVHTRPCFFGDTYWRNNTTFKFAMEEFEDLIMKHDLNEKYEEYDNIPINMKEFYDRPSEDKMFPDLDQTRQFASSFRKPRMFL